MSAFFAMLRKAFVEARWFLLISTAALFGLSWLFVYVVYRIEKDTLNTEDARENVTMVNRTGEFLGRKFMLFFVASRDEINPMAAFRAGSGNRGQGMFRGMGGPDFDNSTAAMEMAFWNHPFVVLTIALWAIGRGSLAISGELERGTMDLVLSRPISRTAFYFTQVAFALLGLTVLAGAMLAGNQLGNRMYPIENPPPWDVVLRPATVVAALGLAMFGYTLFLSSLDIVRWRPNLVASVLTLGMFIINIVANIPTLEDWKWMEQFSIFRAFNPVGAIVKPENLTYNGGILAGIGAAGIVLAWVAFNRRDLPAGA